MNKLEKVLKLKSNTLEKQDELNNALKELSFKTTEIEGLIDENFDLILRNRDTNIRFFVGYGDITFLYDFLKNIFENENNKPDTIETKKVKENKSPKRNS